jgi:hypothetical protein
MTNESLVKVRARHQIQHDGQVLMPGTLFNAPESLIIELQNSGAIDLVEDTGTQTVVTLTPVLAQTPSTSPQDLKAAADAKRIADMQAAAAATKASIDHRAALAPDGLDSSPERAAPTRTTTTGREIRK